MTKELRVFMPQVAAFIDELRAVFGAENVNPSIRAGMQGEPTFWASENGHEVGTRIPRGAALPPEFQNMAKGRTPRPPRRDYRGKYANTAE